MAADAELASNSSATGMRLQRCIISAPLALQQLRSCVCMGCRVAVRLDSRTRASEQVLGDYGCPTRCLLSQLLVDTAADRRSTVLAKHYRNTKDHARTLVSLMSHSTQMRLVPAFSFICACIERCDKLELHFMRREVTIQGCSRVTTSVGQGRVRRTTIARAPYEAHFSHTLCALLR